MIMVDELRVWPTKIKCFQKGSCHLTTDGSLDDLHDFAISIGMKRKWFQENATAPHYDLTPKRREAALAMGAIFVPAKEQARNRKKEQNNG